MIKESPFFENGLIGLREYEYSDRKAILFVRIPCSLFQTITPGLLGFGVIDNLVISDPVSVWLPSLTNARFTDVANLTHDVATRVNSGLRQELIRHIDIFNNLKSYLISPSDIIPFLPLGLYVEFDYRMSADKGPDFLAELQKIQVDGINKIQASFAEILAEIFLFFQRRDARLLNQK